MKKKITLQGILIIIAAALLGITGTTIGVMALMNQAPAVTVEDFVGKTKKTVESWRKDNSIEADRVSYVYSYDEEIKADIVVSQSMKKGDVFKSDSKLKITLSKGADPDKEFELPDFTDKNEKEVKAWFSDNKFTSVTYSYEMNEDVTPGTFISMDKEAGTKVKRSAEIKVVICTPLEGEEVLVPSLSSMSKDDISSWAQQNRINVSFVESANDTIPAGSIISISVNENDRLNPGDTITVEVSTGPADQGEDRYNAQPKEDPPANVTPPTDNSVSGGNPTSPTTPSDNQPVAPPTQSQPETGNTQSTTYIVPEFEPYFFELLDQQSPEVIMDAVNQKIKGNNIPGDVKYIVKEGSFSGIASITEPGTVVKDASEIECVIYYTRTN